MHNFRLKNAINDSYSQRFFFHIRSLSNLFQIDIQWNLDVCILLITKILSLLRVSGPWNPHYHYVISSHKPSIIVPIISVIFMIGVLKPKEYQMTKLEHCGLT